MTVIKRTRLKFFTVMAAIIIVIVMVFCASILISTHSRNNNTANITLEKMVSSFKSDRFDELPDNPPDKPSDGRIPGDRFNDMRGFTVKLNSDFEIAEVRHNSDVFTETEITEYVAQIRETGKLDGKIDSLKFMIKDTQEGKILAGIDTSMENSMYKELLTTVLLVGGGGIIVLLILVWFLSYWIIKPAAEAFQKQKRFISDAGHELKTPLTVISASLDLLQKSSNEADNEKWLKSIKEQTDKMNEMTAELLTLSKIDETEKITKTEFDLSQAVLTEVLAFESVAYEQGKTLVCETDDGINYKGNYQAVRQAVGILCDNAIKYSNPNRKIEAQLKRQPSKIIFSVSNEGDTVNKDEIPLIFERFFRGSESRAESNGAGLGLAILKTLAERNGWKLDVYVEQNKITFSIIF